METAGQYPLPTIDSSPANAALGLIACMVTALERTPLVAICSMDQGGVVRFCNLRFAELCGVPLADVAGRPLSALLSRGERQAEHDAMLADVWRSGRAGPAGDWLVDTADGRQLWLYSTTIPVMHDGQLAQVFCMDVDITQRKVEESALRAAGANFQQLFERSSDAILLLSGGAVADANPAALRLFKCEDGSALAGRTMRELSPLLQPGGELSAAVEAERTVQANRQGNARFEWCYTDCKGEPFWAEVLMTAARDGHEGLYYVVVRDISDRKQAERTLHLAAQVFENSHDAILLTDRKRNVIAINRAYSEVTGYMPDDILGQPACFHRNGVEDDSFQREVWSQIEASGHWQGETLERRKDGASFPCWVSLTAIRDAADRVSNYMAILSDITDRKKSEEHTRHLAEHDFLTDLPNRVLLLDRLSLAMAAGRRSGSMLALMFLDLDRFKAVNDTLGHAMGDRLLQEVAQRLLKCVRGADTVSRQGGDEFVIMLADIGSPARAAHVADLVLQAMAQEFQLDEHQLTVTVSIGIALYPSDGADLDSLLKHADVAMYHAKQSGRNGYQFFSDEMHARIAERSGLEQELKRALAAQQFELAFEPEVDIASGAVVGMEALIRWRHPKRGLLLPEHFIDVAQEAGLMVAIGNWVLQAACQQGRQWHDAGRALVVSVNLSIAQFQHRNLLPTLRDVLASSGLPAASLELQLTEEIIMQAGSAVPGVLRELHALGVRLSIDDFGTGYSRLVQLKDYPIDKLKIAQSFLGAGTDTTAIRTIIAMARSLHMQVIAEGVETEAQLSLLRTLGCDQYQGQLAASAHP